MKLNTLVKLIEFDHIFLLFGLIVNNMERINTKKGTPST